MKPSFIRLIGGFILLRSGLIYTFTDNDEYILSLILPVTVKNVKLMKRIYDLSMLGLVEVRTTTLMITAHQAQVRSCLQHVIEVGCNRSWVSLAREFDRIYRCWT